MRSRIIKTTNLVKCSVCLKDRQPNSFFAEFNPKGKKLTCKHCSFEGKIYCSVCEAIHEKSTLSQFLFRVGETCPVQKKSGVTVTSQEATQRPLYSEMLGLILSALEATADRMSKIEFQNSQIADALAASFSAPSLRDDNSQQVISQLEEREREALELFYAAEEAKKILEDQVNSLKTTLQERENAIEERDAALKALTEGREGIIQACLKALSP